MTIAGIEDWILGVVAIIIGGVISGIILHFLFKRRAEKQLEERQIAKVKKGEVVQAQDSGKVVIDKSHGKRVYHGVGGSPSTEKMTQGKSGRGREKPEFKRKTIKRKISVEPGFSEKVSEYIEKGSLVTGLAEEEYGYNFNFYIIDGDDYAILKSGDEPEEPLVAEFDRPAYHFNVTIPRTGNWYFVFDAYGMKVRRDIDFECTIIEKGTA